MTVTRPTDQDDPLRDPDDLPPPETKAREPIVNIPAVVLVLGAIFALIHLVRVQFLIPDQDLVLFLWFSFIPGRYLAETAGLFPGGIAADAWTFATYAFLHGDVTHLLVNLFWMAAFGSALARRFGTTRFLIFSAACAAAGAGLHLWIYWGEMVPVIGASAAISGHMAGVARFGFAPGGPLMRGLRASGDRTWHVPALSVLQTFSNRNALIFLGIWFAINFLFALGAGPLLGEGTRIAWEAHAGGFIAGLLLFRFLDPTPVMPRYIS
ncbi:MAG: rhomboid family intramembrane serine protease [Pseudomonadota bacterium]